MFYRAAPVVCLLPATAPLRTAARCRLIR